MQHVIADILNINENAISIKATTSEKMGFVGREEGIAAYATILLTATE
jgi:2-C-methyl-D-erythritol 2,4-cyclodiphosphate synthase